MADLSQLDGIIAEVKNFLTSNDAAAKATEKANKDVANLQSGVAKIYEGVARDAALVRLTQDTAALNVQKANNKAAAAAGATPGAEDNVLTKLIGEISKTSVSAVQSMDQVNRERNTSFLDDPMLVLKNAILGSDAETKLEGELARLRVLDSAVAGVNKSLQDTFRTNAALAETTTQASLEANARLTASAAVLKAQEAQIESIKYDAASVDAIAKASKDKVTVLLQLNAAINTEENQQFQREQFKALRQEASDRLAAKKDAQQVDEDFLATINAGQAALGVPLTTAAAWKFEKEMMKAGKRPDLNHYFDIGLRQRATGSSTYGETPSQAFAVMSSLPNANIPAIRQETAKIIIDAERIVSANKTLDPKDKEGRNRAVDVAANDILKSHYQTITPESVFNVGDLSTYIGTGTGNSIKDLANLPISKKVLLPAIAAGVKLDDAKVVLGLVRNSVLEGTITTDEALGISDIYRKASLINQVARGFNAWGLTVPEGGTKYTVRVGGFMNSEFIDMNNPTAVSNYITRALSQQVRGNTVADQISNFGAP